MSNAFQKFLSTGEVASLTQGKRSQDSVLRDINAGRLPAVLVGAGQYGVAIPTAVLYAVKHAVGVTLTGFDHGEATKFATAVGKMARAQAVSVYPLLDLFATMSDEAGRLAVAAAITKLIQPTQLLPGDTGRVTDIVK
jgi:hypothetical protein